MMSPEQWQARVDLIQTFLETLPVDETTVRALLDVAVGTVLAATTSPLVARDVLVTTLERQAKGWIPQPSVRIQ